MKFQTNAQKNDFVIDHPGLAQKMGFSKGNKNLANNSGSKGGTVSNNQSKAQIKFLLAVKPKAGKKVTKSNKGTDARKAAIARRMRANNGRN